MNLKFPSKYLTASGETFVLIGVFDGKVLGARDYHYFDPETLKCVDDSKHDLVEMLREAKDL